MRRRALNLPQTAREQKVWMKKLGITNLKCAKLAVIRDQMATKATKLLAKRDYAGAIHYIHTADKMQSVIENTQNMLKVVG